MIYAQSMAVEARESLNKQLLITVIANFFAQCHHVNDSLRKFEEKFKFSAKYHRL